MPSAQQNKKPVVNQKEWTGAAVRLFSDLFVGATAIEALAGGYKSQETGEIL